MVGRSAPPWLHASSQPRRARWRTLVRRILQAEPSTGFRAWEERARWFRPESVIEGSASTAGIIQPTKCKTIADLKRVVMEWEIRVVEHEGRLHKQILESVKVAALRRMLSQEMAERCMEEPNTNPELRPGTSQKSSCSQGKGQHRWTLESAMTLWTL